MPDDLQTAFRLSVASIAWTAGTSVAAIALGISRNTVVLAAYGLTGLLDAVGSVALALHFRHAIRHQTFSARRERIAHRLVAGGLVAVGLATAAISLRRLAAGGDSRSVVPGVILAGSSAIVLSALAIRKRRAGQAVGSAALVADGWLSSAGALLAVITVAGAGLSGLGWWWADPAAAAVVAMAALGGGVLLAGGQPEPL